MPTTRRQLLAVLFTDIVGYSAMVNRDERRAQLALEAHRRAVRRRVFRHEGRVVDTIGDGFLVTFGSARAAIECAVALQLEFLRRNVGLPVDDQLRLRIGIHVGDVERGKGRVFGDGVNVAARLEPLSPRGGVCASAEAVAQLHGPLRAGFISQGLRELKNIAEPHEVFVLEEGGLEAAAPHLPAIRAWRLHLRKRAPALAVGVALIALAGGWVLQQQGYFESPEDVSVAVLPLENLSEGKDNADFVAGLHDSLLTEVSTMPQLKVISRTSVMRYAHNAPSVPEIGRALKVGYILEGSVQRSARRVRINVQLIRASSDHHIWAKTYDRDAADLFEVQSQIAREIAHSTQGRVVMDAMPRSQRPTTSIEAYDLYLRAIALEDNDPKLGREVPAGQIAMLQQAVLLDPDFALAHAALTRYNIWAANYAEYADPAHYQGYLRAAEVSATKAQAQAPHLPESLVAAGLVSYWTNKERRVAARYFEEALAGRPGYPLALFWVAGVYDKLGLSDKSAAALATLASLDPYNERVYSLICGQQQSRRQYDSLEQTYARWHSLSDTPDYVDFWASEVPFLRTGNLAPRRMFLARSQLRGVTAEDLNEARWGLAMYERRFADAAQLVRAPADEFLHDRSQAGLAADHMGYALAASGNLKAARPYLEGAARYFSTAIRRGPDDDLSTSRLAQIEALLGNASAALAHAQQALDLTKPMPAAPPSRAYYEAAKILGQVEARFGHKQQALERLDWLLREPSGVSAHESLADPAWDPLRQDPDFRSLLAKFGAT